MSEGEITPIHGYWIKENLGRYIFCSDKAKQLEAAFKEIDLESADCNSRLIELYHKFLDLFCNCMYSVAFRMSKKDIISHDIDAYLVKNDYNVLTPIGLLKELNKSYEYDLEIRLQETRESIKKLESELYEQYLPNQENIDKLMKKNIVPLKSSVVIGPVLSILTICLLYQKRNFILNHFTENMIWVWLILGILSLLLNYSAFLEKRKVKVWKNFKTDCEMFKNITIYASDIESKLLDYSEKLKIAMKEGNEVLPQNTANFHKYSICLHKKITNIEKILKRPDKVRKSYSMVHFLLLIGILSLIIFGTKEPYYSNMANFINQLNHKGEMRISDEDENDKDNNADKMEEKVLLGYKKIDIQKAGASSYLHSRSTGIVYDASNTCDEDIRTCWQDGVAGDGIGEYLEYDFDNIQQIIYFNIYNGNLYSEKKYFDNNRPSVIQVDAIREDVVVASMEYYLEDTYTTKPVSLYLKSDSEAIACDKIIIYIMEVYHGDVYKDTCISEIEFYVGVYE